MRRLAILVASVVMLSIAPAVSAAPPEDQVSIIIDFSGEADCDGASLTFHTTGWLDGPFDASHPTVYHLTWVYSNADGASWRYIDTGLIRTFERDGITYISLSGRSTNVGPDNTGWIGHWELDTVTNEVSRVGVGVGEIDQLACNMLASS
jgi:hypothetical protein